MRLAKDTALVVLGLAAFVLGAGAMVLFPEVGLLSLFGIIGFAVYQRRGVSSPKASAGRTSHLEEIYLSD
jgi:hypothetical protein